MDIQRLTLHITESDLAQVLDRYLPKEATVEDARILLQPEGIRVQGSYPTPLGKMSFETLWSLGVSGCTVQARLERLQGRGVITGYGPEVDPAALGYEVTAFVTLEIRQAGGHDPVAERLAAIPEVLEVHTITGAGDLLCRVVARSNADLQRVIDAIVSAEGVVRSATLISLAAQVPYRVLPLVRSAAVS